MAFGTTATIADLIGGKGERQYGLSSINQRAHALQAALLAEQAGCDSALITAALMHDIGHMVHDLGEDPADGGSLLTPRPGLLARRLARPGSPQRGLRGDAAGQK